MKNSSRIIVVVLACLPLGACKLLRGNCHKPGVYASAQSVRPLKVPAGLDAPDTRAALRVPELNEPERVRGPGEPCLDEPPRYVAPKPSGPPPAAKPAPAKSPD
jgi:uncharacterized lipoprotein